MSGAGDLVGRAELPAAVVPEPPASGSATSASAGLVGIGNESAGPWFQWGSARGFVWNRVRLEIAGLSPLLAGLRILHLSDFHATTHWDPAYDDLIAGTRQAPPDLILFTGDFVDSKRDFRPAMPIVRRLVEGLCSRLGMLAILGNHDSDLLAAPMQGWGVTILDGRHMRLAAERAAIDVIGLPGVDRADLDARFLRSIPPHELGSVRIVLSHFPDFIRRVEGLAADIFLAGHTHGGQICLPGGHPLASHDSLPNRFARGIHRFGNTWLVVNRGFGFSSKLRMRMFCAAEAIEIELAAAPQA
jgi:predicted MPP superfamily phosphohydrolase